MPALLNIKHDVFADLYSQGKSLLEAYKEAGFAPDLGNAKRLRKRPDVRARINELRQRAVEFRDVERVRVVLEVDRVGRANIADFYEPEIDEKTGKETGREVLRRISKLPRELSAAIKKVEMGDDGRPAVIEMHDKNQANFTLLKYLGGLPEPEAAKQNVSIFNVLSIEDQRVLADALESIGGGPRGVDHEIAGERPASAEIP